MAPDLQPPWREFLSELDGLLPEPVELHCVGGFVMTTLYGFRRTTAALDYYDAIPSRSTPILLELAGRDSRLASEHHVHLQLAALASLPDGYEARLVEIAPGTLARLRLFAPEAHDLALSKLARNHQIDRDDVAYLVKAIPLDAALLRERYVTELRPGIIGDLASHDLTLDLWLEEYFRASS
jgi:Nucleotidyltransferase of unknown function (DUF6036)